MVACTKNNLGRYIRKVHNSEETKEEMEEVSNGIQTHTILFLF